MRDLTLTAIGKDRPGIVSGVSRVLYELGCNLADCSMTRLSDEFAMILLVHAPDSVTQEGLRAAMDEPGKQLGLHIQVLEGPHEPTPSVRNPLVVSLYGADHPGIVYKITEELGARGVNITDLVSRIAGDSVFLMVLEIDVPDSVDVGSLQAALQKQAAKLGVELTVRPAETADL